MRLRRSGPAVPIGFGRGRMRWAFVERVRHGFGLIGSRNALLQSTEGGFDRREASEKRVELLGQRADLLAQGLRVVLRKTQRLLHALNPLPEIVRRHRGPLCLVSIPAVLLASPAAEAETGLTPERLRTEFRGIALQPAESEPLPDPGRFETEFGDPEPLWISLATSAAVYSGGSDHEGTIKLTKFIVPKRLEVGGELGAWRFVQPGDDAFGVSAGLVIRWHFIVRERHTFFADAGLSILAASDLVPDRGTGFNFMPKLGIGATWQPTESAWRVFGALRWHHISNARIGGEVANPSRDQPLLQVGLEFPL